MCGRGLIVCFVTWLQNASRVSHHYILQFYHAVLSRAPFNNFFRRKMNAECKLDVLKRNKFPSENKATRKQHQEQVFRSDTSWGLISGSLYGSETTTTMTALTSKEQPVETCTSWIDTPGHNSVSTRPFSLLTSNTHYSYIRKISRS